MNVLKRIYSAIANGDLGKGVGTGIFEKTETENKTVYRLKIQSG